MSSPMKDYWKNYIGGKWVDGSDGLCCTKPLMSEVPLSPDGFIPRFL